MAGTRLEYLFDCYVNQRCSKEEEKELMEMMSQTANEGTIQTLIDNVIGNTVTEVQMPDQVAASILKNIFERDKCIELSLNSKKTVYVPWMRVAVAAVLVMVLAAYGILGRKDNAKKVVKADKKHSPILPGGNKAFLTMSDGRVIILDSLKNRTLQNGSTKINKVGNLLIYDISFSSKPNAHVVYNTLTTPRGGQYQVVLPDGSKVWLNAASSLHFPTAFANGQRNVELTGEAYFEVAKNKEKPFQVNVNGMQVKVLGTHFNVNAYPDEDAVKTSLLEGGVQITKGNASGLLMPGQQAVLKTNDNKVEIINVDLNKVMAWKNGLFRFEGADINTIMREIGRWYDVEIVYAGSVPLRWFEGKISRNMQLSEVLKILELSGAKFTVEDKKIIVK